MFKLNLNAQDMALRVSLYTPSFSRSFYSSFRAEGKETHSNSFSSKLLSADPSIQHVTQSEAYCEGSSESISGAGWCSWIFCDISLAFTEVNTRDQNTSNHSLQFYLENIKVKIKLSLCLT